MSKGLSSAVGTALRIFSIDLTFNSETAHIKNLLRSFFEKLPIGFISALLQSYFVKYPLKPKIILNIPTFIKIRRSQYQQVTLNLHLKLRNQLCHYIRIQHSRSCLYDYNINYLNILQCNIFYISPSL